MAEELQSLLEKINQDGVMKAEAKKAEIIADAEAQAARIVAEAEKNAANIVKAAEKDSEAITNRAASALEQAKRDIVLQLRDELAGRLHQAVADAGAKALSPEFMAGLVRELAMAFSAAPESVITVRSAIKDADALEKALQAALADSFVKAPQLFAGREITGGMEVSFDGGKCFYDFTLDAVTDLMDEYIGANLASAFKAQ